MERRTSLEIMAEILRFCREPQNKTRVMLKANLSWKMLQNYLVLLQSQGLLEVHHSSIRYVATQKGLKFVEKWKQLAELLSMHSR